MFTRRPICVFAAIHKPSRFPDPATVNTNPMTVLIADDNARFRRLLRTLLEGTTSIVAEAANGTEAVQLYHRHHPDWVLMDIRMTILDGLKATMEILAEDPAARILIVSHYDDEQSRAAAREAGAAGFVSKENIADILTFMGTGPSTGAVSGQSAAQQP